MFTGLSIHTLDDKGRLAIPARYRDLLKTKQDERLVVTTSDHCLVAYPNEDWQTLSDKVGRLSQMDPRVQAFRRFFISGANECLCDRQGRVLIPQALRELAGLNGQVLVVGMQSNFEIWDKDRWHAEREKFRGDFGDLSSFMAGLGL